MKNVTPTKKGPGRVAFTKADTPKANREHYGAWQPLAKLRKKVYYRMN